MAESYNIAAFLGKIEGSDELRRPIPLHRDDVLVLDEASQLSTTDLAMIGEAARQAGARITATGDTAQLGAVEAGGMFRLLAREVPAAQLHEVRRFEASWERKASVRLRDGDLAAVAAYDRHGRIRGADAEAAYDRATSMWLADHLRGKDVLLLAGSNAEAAELSRRVQARLIQLGTVGPPQAALSDGNQAGVGDLVRARLNAKIDAGGRRLANRDTLKITALRGPDAQVRRQRADGTWTEKFRVPRSYLAGNAELGYGGNVHVAQGRTVDTAHLLVTDSLSRQALYVGMTRGRESNTAHVVTGKTAPSGKKPYQQAAPESVLASVLQRDAGDLSATGQIRQAQEQAGGTGHLLHLWSAATRQALYPDIDERIKARLTQTEGWRYDREHSRQVLQHKLRDAQLAGHDVGEIIDRITAAPMDGARSISSVLHDRLHRLQLPGHGHSVTWAQRTPQNALALAHELAAGLDHRRRELGEQALQNPEPWLTRHLGAPPGPDASPVLREDYAQRAGTAAAYREARGITDPEQAVSLDPHPEPELEALRRDTVRALEIAGEQAELRAMSRGELEGQVLQGERAQATAPRDVSSQLHLTWQADADAWQQAADAEAQHDQVRADNARWLATALATQTSRLEAANARYEEWSVRTASTREMAGKAKAELQHRGQEPAAGEAPGPQRMAAWWREFQADADALDRAIEREHQAAVSGGQPWPPDRKPEAGHEEPDAAAPGCETQLAYVLPGILQAQTDPEPEPRHPSWKHRAPRLPDLSPLTTDAPPGLMSRRPARTRPRAGSTHSGQSLTPAASTPRGWSGRPRPSRRLIGRPRRPMTWKWSCRGSGRVGVAGVHRPGRAGRDPVGPAGRKSCGLSFAQFGLRYGLTCGTGCP